MSCLLSSAAVVYSAVYLPWAAFKTAGASLCSTT